MIADKLSNLSLYTGAHPQLAKALEFLNNFSNSGLPDGHYELDGDEIYANIFTKPNGPDATKRWESHEHYIDLQYIAEGGQRIYWANTAKLAVETPYNPEKDITFYKPFGGTCFDLSVGEFLLLWPEDAHRPDCETAGSDHTRKIVIKIKAGK